MKTVSIHDAKTNLSKYIAEAKHGEKIYIGSFGKAEVVLTKVKYTDLSSGRAKALAKARGKITVQPDAFSAKTEKEITDLMLGQ